MSGRRLLKADVLAIHEAVISRFGVIHGLRDEGLDESALAQPHQTFGGSELYPTVEE